MRGPFSRWTDTWPWPVCDSWGCTDANLDTDSRDTARVRGRLEDPEGRAQEQSEDARAAEAGVGAADGGEGSAATGPRGPRRLHEDIHQLRAAVRGDSPEGASRPKRISSQTFRGDLVMMPHNTFRKTEEGLLSDSFYGNRIPRITKPDRDNIKIPRTCGCKNPF